MDIFSTTQEFLIQENKVPNLTWVNVAIAAGFIVINGKDTKNKQFRY